MKRTTSIRSLLIVTLVTSISLLLVAATPKASPQSSGTVSAIESVTKRGKNKAVEFTWKENGVAKSFSSISQGKTVILNLWATWCPPCRREIPDLVELSKDLASKGVVVVGVSLDEGEKRLNIVKTFVEKNSISYLNLVDTQDSQLSQAYGPVSSIPVTFIIDKNGNVVEKLIGMRTKAQFLEAVNRAM